MCVCVCVCVCLYDSDLTVVSCICDDISRCK